MFSESTQIMTQTDGPGEEYESPDMLEFGDVFEGLRMFEGIAPTQDIPERTPSTEQNASGTNAITKTEAPSRLDTRHDGRRHVNQEGNHRASAKSGPSNRRIPGLNRREPCKLKNTTAPSLTINVAVARNEINGRLQAAEPRSGGPEQKQNREPHEKVSTTSINTALARSSKVILELVANKMKWVEKEVPRHMCG
jgi:hypothetical protein